MHAGAHVTLALSCAPDLLVVVQTSRQFDLDTALDSKIPNASTGLALHAVDRLEIDTLLAGLGIVDDDLPVAAFERLFERDLDGHFECLRLDLASDGLELLGLSLFLFLYYALHAGCDLGPEGADIVGLSKDGAVFVVIFAFCRVVESLVGGLDVLPGAGLRLRVEVVARAKAILQAAVSLLDIGLRAVGRNTQDIVIIFGDWRFGLQSVVFHGLTPLSVPTGSPIIQYLPSYGRVIAPAIASVA